MRLDGHGADGEHDGTCSDDETSEPRTAHDGISPTDNNQDQEPQQYTQNHNLTSATSAESTVLKKGRKRSSKKLDRFTITWTKLMNVGFDFSHKHMAVTDDGIAFLQYPKGSIAYPQTAVLKSVRLSPVPEAVEGDEGEGTAVVVAGMKMNKGVKKPV